MRAFVYVISFIAMTIISVAGFLWIYNEVGFKFTPYCLFSWAFGIAAWAVIVRIFLLIFDIE